MEKNRKLGLPLAYESLSEYFDLFNKEDETIAKNNYLAETLLKKHKVKKVLDMTCGTGEQVLYLKEKGYDIVASDISEHLLKIAKSKTEKKGLEIQYHQGSMEFIQVGKFDGVITIHNAIGHLNKKQFMATLKNINKNLNIGGIYIFDIFNLKALTASIIGDFAMNNEHSDGKTKIFHIQCSTLEEKTGKLNSYDHYVMQKNGEKPINLKNKFSLQLYTAEELEKMLKNCGFGFCEFYSLDGTVLNPLTSQNIFTVAKKTHEI